MDVSSLQAMLNWAVRSEMIVRNPLALVPALPAGEAQRRYRRRAMSDAEIARFLAAAAADDRNEADHRAAVRTIVGGTKGKAYESQPRRWRIPQLPLWVGFLETGAWWAELTRVVWADVDTEKNTLVLRAETTKSGKTRTIPYARASSTCCRCSTEFTVTSSAPSRPLEPVCF